MLGPVFLAVLLGVFEVSWQLAVSAALDRGTMHAGRFGMSGQAGTGSIAPGCRSQSIPRVILAASGNLLKAERLTVTLGAVPGASGLGGTQTPGAGLGGQVAIYTVTYTQPFTTLGWAGVLGAPAQIVHQSSVVVKNEAFDTAVC